MLQPPRVSPAISKLHIHACSACKLKDMPRNSRDFVSDLNHIHPRYLCYSHETMATTRSHPAFSSRDCEPRFWWPDRAYLPIRRRLVRWPESSVPPPSLNPRLIWQTTLPPPCFCAGHVASCGDCGVAGPRTELIQTDSRLLRVVRLSCRLANPCHSAIVMVHCSRIPGLSICSYRVTLQQSVDRTRSAAVAAVPCIRA